MNYFVTIWSSFYETILKDDSLFSKLAPQTISINKRSIAFIETDISDWHLIVYTEPEYSQNEKREKLIDDYISDIICKVNNHVKTKNKKNPMLERIYFHFTNIYPEHDEDERCDCSFETIPQTNYPKYEEKLRKETRAGGKVDFWGFHATGSLAKALCELASEETSFIQHLSSIDLATMNEEKNEQKKKISDLCHGIGHIFPGIDLDLQRLAELSQRGKGEFIKKWEEISKLYKDVDWNIKFNEVRAIVNEYLAKHNRKINDYNELKNILVNDSRAVEIFLCGLNNSSEFFNEIKAKNIFYEWFRKLINELVKTFNNLDKEEIK